MRGNWGQDWGQWWDWGQNQGPVTGCLDLLPQKNSDPQFEKWLSHGYLIFDLQNEVEDKAEAEEKWLSYDYIKFLTTEVNIKAEVQIYIENVFRT